jgi:V/A-type H+-transporting ATPase subunit B
VIGEDELSNIDKKYIQFGNLFEKHYLSQNNNQNRPIEQTLDLGWNLLSVLPKSELDRVDEKLVSTFYNQEKAFKEFQVDDKILIHKEAM